MSLMDGMLDEDELRAIANSKNSTFQLEAVIAAKSPESRDKTHESIKKICAVIIEAYKQTTDPYSSQQAKKDSVNAVINLRPQLDWLITFAREETDWCHTPELNKKMQQLTNDLDRHIQDLYSEFHSLEKDINKFRPIFDSLLEVLKKMTAFFRYAFSSISCFFFFSSSSSSFRN
jgi:hypothetical protein